jgi:hypothetical protein
VNEKPANHHLVADSIGVDIAHNDSLNLMIHRIEGGNHEEDVYEWKQTQEESTLRLNSAYLIWNIRKSQSCEV